MTLARVWPNGVPSMPLSTKGLPQLDGGDLGAVDQNVQSCLDKTYRGDNAYATITLGPGGAVSLDSPTSSFSVNANSTSSTGGRFQCGHGDFPVLTPGINVFRYSSLGEMFSNVGGAATGSTFWPITYASLNWEWYVDPAGSVLSGTNVNVRIANGAAVIPLTRISDAQVITSVSVNFIVASSRTILPTRYPGIQVFQYDPFLNAATSISGGSWQYFSAPANIAAYKNGGAANILSVSAGITTVDATKYVYFLALLDEDYNAESSTTPNQFTGLEVATATSSLQFQ